MLFFSWVTVAHDSYLFDIAIEVDGTAPQTSDNYDGSWYNEDFIIYLSVTDIQSQVEDTYYRINEDPVYSLSIAGQPVISTESEDNQLEYWSIDEFDNEELPHNLLREIKLDKTSPTVTIVSPEDEQAFSESPITISGMVEDNCSGVKDIEVEVEGAVYIPLIGEDGSFSVTDINIVGGPNRILALSEDVAGNEGEDTVTAYLGWVMHLPIPYYQVGDYYSGAACSQMVLNYMRDGVADELTQEEIYNYGYSYNYEENAELLEMDARAVDYALGHFDPYDRGDPTGQGNPYRGYNFSIEVFESDEFTEYLRDIIHWMAYPVTVDYWWLDGDLVAQPHTPAVVPAYGNYEHWLVVNGASTSENPVPEPHTNPWYTPDFTVYGLWLTDPVVDGVGQDLYVIPREAQDTYLFTLVSEDRHNGKYVQVAEPPQVPSGAEVQMSKPKVNEETLRVVEIAKDINKNQELMTKDHWAKFEQRLQVIKRHIYDAALVVELKDDSKSKKNEVSEKEERDLLRLIFDINAQAPVELDWKKIISSSLLTDEDFREAIDGAQARSFIKVKRTDKDNSFYYLIPFDKYVKGQFLTAAAIIIDAEDGSFQQASMVQAPVRFIQVSKEKALELVLAQSPQLQDTELTVELVWKPGGLSPSPFYPYWRITVGDQEYLITPKGTLFTTP